MYSSISYCIALHYIILSFTILHYIILYHICWVSFVSNVMLTNGRSDAERHYVP